MMFQTTIAVIAQTAAKTAEKKPYTPISFEQVIIWVAVLASLILFGFYIVSVFRGNARGAFEESTGQLDEFRKLREEGMLNEEEFSHIRTSMVNGPDPEINESNEDIDFSEDTSDDVKNDDQE